MSHHTDYHGPDDITIGNGKSLSISHVGSSHYTTHNKIFNLKHIFHVPDACSNLLSVSSFTNSNDVLVEFFPSYFEIKDIHTRNLLLTGLNDGGLYSLAMALVSNLSRPQHAFLCSLST